MSVDDLLSHLSTGATHICHCWSLTRRDGVKFGFTDHDAALTFEGQRFSPESGLSAKALASTTGLSVNNTEAVGILSSDAITEADIHAGRYDGAAVVIWKVCWDNVAARKVLFRGSLGEITRSSGGFQAELLGLTDMLNQPQGRSYLAHCSAVLGDARCTKRVNDPAYRLNYTLDADSAGLTFALQGIADFHAGWFAGGTFAVLSGDAAGLTGMIKSDTGTADREVKLWAPISAPVRAGDRLPLHRLQLAVDARRYRRRTGPQLRRPSPPAGPADPVGAATAQLHRAHHRSPVARPRRGQPRAVRR